MSVSVLENKTFHKGLGTNLVPGCFSSTHKNESRKSYQINKLSTRGMRPLEKGKHATLKLFEILNLGKSLRHITQVKNTETETFSEATDSIM